MEGWGGRTKIRDQCTGSPAQVIALRGRLAARRAAVPRGRQQMGPARRHQIAQARRAAADVHVLACVRVRFWPPRSPHRGASKPRRFHIKADVADLRHLPVAEAVDPHAPYHAHRLFNIFGHDKHFRYVMNAERAQARPSPLVGVNVIGRVTGWRLDSPIWSSGRSRPPSRSCVAVTFANRRKRSGAYSDQPVLDRTLAMPAISSSNRRTVPPQNSPSTGFAPNILKVAF